VRDIKPTPWRLLRSLQAVLWAVLVLCVGNALACRTVNPLDLPQADTADTAKTRAVALAKSAEILALEEMAESAETDVGEELRTPYSYVGNAPLVGVDPTGEEFIIERTKGEPLSGYNFADFKDAVAKIGAGEIKNMTIEGHGNPWLITFHHWSDNDDLVKHGSNQPGEIRLTKNKNGYNLTAVDGAERSAFDVVKQLKGKFAKDAVTTFLGCEVADGDVNIVQQFSQQLSTNQIPLHFGII